MILRRACWTPSPDTSLVIEGFSLFARDLIHLVDIDDTPGGLLDIVVGGLQEVEDDVFHVLTHVAGLGEARGIGDGEGNLQEFRQRLGQQGLARPGGAQQQDIALLKLDIAGLGIAVDAFVVIVDGHREDFLGPFLADDVFVEELLYLHRFGYFRARAGKLLALVFFGDNIVAELNAFVADEARRSRDQFLDVFLVLAAERAEHSRFLVFISEIIHSVPLLMYIGRRIVS